MYYRYYFGMAKVYTPFTRDATKGIYNIVHREGHLLRDASDINREKTVIIDFKGFKIEVDIYFNSGSRHIVRIHVDPRGDTVMRINKIKRWRKINKRMDCAK